MANVVKYSPAIPAMSHKMLIKQTLELISDLTPFPTGLTYCNISAEMTFNLFPHTTNLQKTTSKTYWQRHEKSSKIMV